MCDGMAFTSMRTLLFSTMYTADVHCSSSTIPPMFVARRIEVDRADAKRATPSCAKILQPANSQGPPAGTRQRSGYEPSQVSSLRQSAGSEEQANGAERSKVLFGLRGWFWRGKHRRARSSRLIRIRGRGERG